MNQARGASVVYRRWLPTILIGSALVNAALTSLLPAGSLPIRSHPDPSLTYLVRTEGISLDKRFSLYMHLGDAARGGTLIVPLGAVVSGELVEGLAGMDMVERDFDARSWPPEVATSGPPLGLYETAIGDLPYWILPGDGELWWLGQTDQVLVVVSDSVAPVPGSQP